MVGRGVPFQNYSKYVNQSLMYSAIRLIFLDQNTHKIGEGHGQRVHSPNQIHPPSRRKKKIITGGEGAFFSQIPSPTPKQGYI